jgi:hypothetical protein
MKKIFMTMFCLLLVAIELIFIGIPIPYHYQTYEIVSPNDIFSDIEFVFRVYPSDNSYFVETIPIQKGNPYEILIDVYHHDSKYESITINSLKLVNQGKIIDVVAKPYTQSFSIFEKGRMEFPLDTLTFDPNTKINLLCDFQLITYDGVSLHFTFDKYFVAKEDKGLMFISLMELFMAAG